MKEEVTIRDTLRLLTYEDCVECVDAELALTIGAHIRAPSVLDGALIEGELVQISLKSSARECAGTVLQPYTTTPLKTVSLLGPLCLLCKNCRRVIGDLTLWT